MKFLEAVAKRYVDYGPLDRVCFVFPNRRSGTFFKRYLGIEAKRPVFVPHVLTIDELFSRIAGKEETKEKPRLLFILYEEYVRLMPRPEGASPEPFDQFIFWGDILLSDFDDIDKYRVDVEKLLINLRDFKSISAGDSFLSSEQRNAIATFCRHFYEGQDESEWNEENLPETSSRPKFAKLWNILLPLYHAFRTRLEKEGLAYAGMNYRAVAEALDEKNRVLPQFQEFVFVGLNALNQCEKELLKQLQTQNRAQFYWDFPTKMEEDADNPAGFFLRDNCKDFPQEKGFSCPEIKWDPENPPYFEVISIPSAVGQTQKAMQILDGLHRDKQMSDPVNTAVVLPDENLLFPMLGSIPARIPDVNVTMGYPLSASSGVSLFQILERLQQNKRQRDGLWCFYHRDVINLLEHPYLAAASDPSVVASIKDGILKNKSIFVPVSDLSGNLLFPVLFKPVEGTQEIPGYLKEIIEGLQSFQSPVEREFLSHFHQAVSALENAGLHLDELLPRTWYRLLSQCIGLVKIPFEGEPLKGLQIMGPLETRALDFDNIIILSVNECTFPSRTVSSSFIPYILRKGFGLPTFERQDAIWAYYFYRLIARAKRVYLLYDSRSEGIQSGEESRFIKQLRHLYPVRLVEKVATYEMGSDAIVNPLMHVEKTDDILQKLSDRFVGENAPGVFSASSLNSYLDCPLRFYYSYLEGIKELEEVTEDVDASLFGSIFHRIMELLYKPFARQKSILREEDLSENRLFGPGLEKLEALTAQVFSEYHIHEIAGENLIRKDIIIRMVREVVKTDRKLAGREPFRILATEEDVRYPLTLPDGRTVTLYGKIDRRDQVGTRERIVDYKSGKVEGNLLKPKKDQTEQEMVDSFFDAAKGSNRPSIAFQLYFYALLKPGAEPCIYSLTSIFKEDPHSYSVEQTKLVYFKDKLTTLIEEILSPSQRFEPRPELEEASSFQSVCKYCYFKRLCNRE